ncbi:MAG: PAS domain-containing sensor histidine kinase [Phycisphaeraceae bacterium]
MSENLRENTHIRDHGQLYRLVLRSLQEYAVFTIDLNMRIATWNPGARAVFGYNEDEVIGQSTKIIFTPEDRQTEEPLKEIQTALDTGRANDERWHVRKDGSLFWAEGIVNPLRNDEGEAIGYVKIVRDLTERKEAHDQLRQLNETLEQRVAERTEQVRQMATRLSEVEHRERRKIADDLHDHLAQLLVSCRMKLSLVEPADDASREMRTEVDRALGEAMKYVRTLIAELRPTVLHEQGLPAAIGWLAQRMQERFRLSVKVESEDDLKSLSGNLSTVLFNAVRELLMNVVKHSQVKEAEVSLRRRGDEIEVIVADQGVGFRMEENRSPGAATDTGGYGLFSVRERIRLIGGRIDVESAPGEGSQITLTVPMNAGAFEHVAKSTTIEGVGDREGDGEPESQ